MRCTVGLGNALMRVNSSSVSDSSDVAISSSTANARSADDAVESSPEAGAGNSIKRNVMFHYCRFFMCRAMM
jgi:hypothetical protein